MKKLLNIISKVAIVYLTLSGIGVYSANADIAVVISPSNQISSMTEKEVNRIFMGFTKRFPNGGKVSIVNQSEANAIRSDFDKTVNKTTMAKVNARWASLAFSGRTEFPPMLKSDEEVIMWLEKNTNGIGYIDSSKVSDKVKVVLTIQ